MKALGTVLVVCMVCSVAVGEYAELEALRRGSGEALKMYGERLAGVDAKFAGVVRFGEALKGIMEAREVDVGKVTGRSKDYWRAVLEMVPEDPSVLFAHGYLHAARGETAWADAYFLIGSLTAGKAHRAELDVYRRLRDGLEKRVGREIERGIKLHDRREYEKAVAVYDGVIAAYPSYGLAYYEKGLSYMMMSKEDPDMKPKAMAMYGQCRQCDPFHWKAYQGGDPNVIGKLMVYLEKVYPFVSGKERNKEGFAAFAEGCEGMELYVLAAHARWKLSLIDGDNVETHVKRFLDLIEKCGCEDADFFRSQFQFSDDK